MLIVRAPSSINGISAPGIRILINQRFSQILSGETYDHGQHDQMIVVESGDNIDSLESETSCPICITPSMILDMVKPISHLALKH